MKGSKGPWRRVSAEQEVAYVARLLQLMPVYRDVMRQRGQHHEADELMVHTHRLVAPLQIYYRIGMKRYWACDLPRLISDIEGDIATWGGKQV